MLEKRFQQHKLVARGMFGLLIKKEMAHGFQFYVKFKNPTSIVRDISHVGLSKRYFKSISIRNLSASRKHNIEKSEVI